MNGKKLVLTGLSTALALSFAAEAFAAPRHGGRMVPEVMFVRLLKQDDADKNGRITPEEAKAGAERRFDLIDADKDGNITPGEMRVWREKKHEERKAEREKMRAERETAQNDEDAMPGDGKGGMKHRHGDRDHDGKGRFGMMHRGGGMLFRVADKDENGQVSKQEALAAADKMFQRLDRNKDGAISLDDMPDR